MNRPLPALEFSELDLLAMFPYDTRDDHVLVDVGGHVGSVSRVFAQRAWKVIAFEPEPENYRGLCNTLSQYPGAFCIRKAISDVAGQEIPFYVSEEHWGIHSLKPFHPTHKPSITVETVRLDETLQRLGVQGVTLLKVDTEGADFGVLRSFDFKEQRPEVVMCEYMDDRSEENYDYSHHDVVKYMEQFNYVAYISEWAPIAEYGRKGETGSAHRFIQCVRYPLPHRPSWGNLMFVAQEKAHFFAAALEDYLSTLARRAKA
jgi:FkbM family methyltransferase